MATLKLYPPILAGTTPPFYKSSDGTYILDVPFSFNKLVSSSEIGGVKLRIRDAETDIELGKVDALNFSVSNTYSHAEFNLTNINGINIGKYYKIQLAYIDINDASLIGYYSSISIVKCTAYPAVSILGLNQYGINTDNTYYTGYYSNINDSSEKCYQYKFTLYNNNNEVLTTTSWMIHNSNTDDTSWESTDSYILDYVCENNERYKLQYSVITQNGLEIHSPYYILLGNTAIAPDIDVSLNAEMDYDNGCVNLFLVPNDIESDSLYTGMFIISRSCANEDFKIQTKLISFNLTGSLPKDAIFRDFTVEHGQQYKYSLQQFNNYNIYSMRIQSPIITAVFEDIFLYDGQRQLKVRFNPQVTSFKTVIQENKKNTLGSKYPFFLRSGLVEYKEFPISGLISYLGDENEFFLSRKNDLHMSNEFEITTNIVDDNITYERMFKLAVLDWLNNGEIKLFRSPAEGNYIVRLTNVSLTPERSLSRMIHTFSCTADEIDNFSSSKLTTYGFLSLDEDMNLELRFQTINFNDYIENLIQKHCGSIDISHATNEQVDDALKEFARTNLLKGCQCQYIKFENCLGGETSFTLDNSKTILVGATGQYEISFPEDAMISSLIINEPERHMPGSVTVGIWTKNSTIFDSVVKVNQFDVIDCPSYLGTVTKQIDSNTYELSTNYLDTITTIKDQIKVILSMDFSLSTLVYEIQSLNGFRQSYNFDCEPILENIYEQINLYVQTPLIDHFLTEVTEIYKITFNNNNDSTIAPETLGNRSARDLFVDGAVFLAVDENLLYYFDKTTSTLVAMENHEPYVETEFGYQQLSPTQICIDGEIIDIAITQSYHIPMTSTIPKFLAWGSMVQPLFVYQLSTIVYGVEQGEKAFIIPSGYNTNLYYAWNDVNNGYAIISQLYQANRLQLDKLTSTDDSIRKMVNQIPEELNNDNSYFIWNNETLHFEKLTNAQRAIFTGNEIWVPHLSYDFSLNDIQAVKNSYQPYNGRIITKENYLNAKDTYLNLLQEVLTQEDIEVVS